MGALDAIEWACVLCGRGIQNDRASRATNLHQILHEAWTFLHGNYLDDSEGRSCGQLVIGSSITTTHPLMHHVSGRVFWWNIKSPRWLTHLQSRFGVLQLLAFPKTKITFERKEVLDRWWGSGKYDRAAEGDLENRVRSQDAYFEGDWGVIVLCTMFLVFCIFFNKCLYFSYYMAGYFLDFLTVTQLPYLCTTRRFSATISLQNIFE